MQIKRILGFVEKYTLYLVVALYTVFAFSFGSASLIIPKEILIVVSGSILLILWVLKMIVGEKLSFSSGRFDLGVLLIGLSYFLSTLLKTPNKMEAYLFPGATTFILVSVIFYFLVNQFDKKVKGGVAWALTVSSLLLSLSVLFTELGLFAKIPQLPAFVRDANFNPIGGNLPTIIYLGTLIPMFISLAIKEKDIAKKLFLGVSGFVVIFALSLLTYKSLPGMPQYPRFVSLQNSWEVGVEAVKKSPVWGIGAGNYLTAFNLYKPVSYNATDLWNVRFTTARNFYLTILTEVGFAGVLAFTLLIISIYNALLKDFKGKGIFEIEDGQLAFLSVPVMALFFAFFPASSILMFPFFILLSLFSKSEEKVIELNVVNSSSKVPAVILGIPIAAGVVAVLFFGYRIVAAENKFRLSLDALAKNDAKGTYDMMREAVSTNPKVDRYHASFAQINMALATSVAGKENLSDEDKSTISQLVQQAIAEGKASVTLNPQRSGNWEALARIYRSIMPFAQGADSFAIQTFTQAVTLDPINPNLRIALGGTYYALGRFDEAIEAFKLAVVAKPDLANAHYNLASAYREKKDFDNAVSQMNMVLSLVEKDSPDYNLAKAELESLEKNRPAKVSESTENLSAPQPAQEPVIKPPIELPQEANPPETGPIDTPTP